MAFGYIKNLWEKGKTLLSAENFNHMEDGIANMWSYIYPVGSIYMSVNNTSPETLFGGTWEAVSSGYTLMATDSNGGTYSSTSNSNAKTLTASQIPSLTTGTESAGHTHSTTVSFSASGSHAHPYNAGGHAIGLYTTNDPYGLNTYGFVGSQNAGWWQPANKNAIDVAAATHAHSGSFASGGVSANHTHTYTNNSQQSLDVTNANLKVYMWKRTA